MDECSVGKASLHGKCHKNIYTKSTENKLLSELVPKTREILMWPCGLNILNAHATVCHHEYVLLNRFQMEQNICCNPFKLHGSKRKGIISAVQRHNKKPLLLDSPVIVVLPHCQSNFVSFFVWCNNIKSVCKFITPFLKPVAEKL